MERSYASIGGIEIAVEDHGGTGEPVVLVHGLGGSAGNWGLTAPQMARFARVVAIDLPGHGRSAPAPRHDLDTHVATLCGVLERLGPATLVGNSMGGLVCEMVAGRRPQTVSGLLLLAPATPPASLDWPSPVAIRLLVQSLPKVGTKATESLIARMTPEEQVRETLRIVMHDPTRLPEVEVRRAVETTRLRRTMPWAARAFSESLASTRRLLVRRATFDGLVDAIQAPTTLVYGSADRVVHPSGLRRLARRRAEWRSIELPDTGHTPMFERPEIVVVELERLLQRVEGLAPPQGGRAAQAQTRPNAPKEGGTPWSSG